MDAAATISAFMPCTSSWLEIDATLVILPTSSRTMSFFHTLRAPTDVVAGKPAHPHVKVGGEEGDDVGLDEPGDEEGEDVGLDEGEPVGLFVMARV